MGGSPPSPSSRPRGLPAAAQATARSRKRREGGGGAVGGPPEPPARSDAGAFFRSNPTCRLVYSEPVYDRPMRSKYSLGPCLSVCTLSSTSEFYWFFYLLLVTMPARHTRAIR